MSKPDCGRVFDESANVNVTAAASAKGPEQEASPLVARITEAGGEERAFTLDDLDKLMQEVDSGDGTKTEYVVRGIEGVNLRAVKDSAANVVCISLETSGAVEMSRKATNELGAALLTLRDILWGEPDGE